MKVFLAFTSSETSNFAKLQNGFTYHLLSLHLKFSLDSKLLC
jgi:hypothetical protein